MDFTETEQAYIARHARDADAPWPWGGYVAILVPILAFGLYGCLKGDVLALALAFFSLFGTFVWVLVAGAGATRTTASICRKLHAQARTTDTPD